MSRQAPILKQWQSGFQTDLQPFDPFGSLTVTDEFSGEMPEEQQYGPAALLGRSNASDPGNFRNGPPSPGASFYVKDRNGNLVGAQFLSNNGTFVLDPNASVAENTPLFNAQGQPIAPDSAGYLIVPADYSLSNPETFAAEVGNLLAGRTVTGNTEYLPGPGLDGALGLMTGAFVAGGSEDLQRTYDGITNGTPVTGFIDAASVNLGIVDAYAGLPVAWAEMGGGAYNQLKSWFFDASSIFGSQTVNLNTAGAWGNYPQNVTSLTGGYSLGLSLPGAGNYPQDPSTVDVGGGNGTDFLDGTITATPQGAPEIYLDLRSGGSEAWAVDPASGIEYEDQSYSAPAEGGSLTSLGAGLAPTTGNAVDAVTLGNYQINLGTLTSASITGTNNVIYLGGDDIVGAIGGGNSIIGSGNVITQTGSGIDYVTGNSNSLTQSTISTLALTGSYNTLTGVSGASLVLGGGSVATVTTVGEDISAWAAGVVITASSDSIALYNAGITNYVTGNSNKITQGAVDTLALGGVSNTVTGISGAALVLAAGAGASVTTAGGNISTWGTSGINLGGSGDTIGLYDAGTKNYVTGNSNNITQSVVNTLALAGVSNTVIRRPLGRKQHQSRFLGVMK